MPLHVHIQGSQVGVPESEDMIAAGDAFYRKTRERIIRPFF